MSELFDKNLEFLKTNYRTYYGWFANAMETSAIPIFSDGLPFDEEGIKLDGTRDIVNLDIGDRLLYDEDSEGYSRLQLDKFKENPERFWIGFATLSHPTLRSNQALAHIREKAQNHFTKERKEEKFDSELMVCLGLGLGHQIEPMIEELDVKYLFVLESFREFFYYSLYIVDWQKIHDILKKRGGSLTLICGDYYQCEAMMISQLRDNAIGRLDGMLIYHHYPSSSTAKLRRALINNMSYIGANMGFFEDEIVMMANSFQNMILNNPSYYWYQKPRFEKETPVIVVGAGPSLDQDLELLYEHQENLVIISCGTALRVLLKNNIRPQFHVVLENTLNQEGVIENIIQDGFSLEGISLVASASVYYKVARYFDNKIFFFRDHLSTESLLHPQCPTITLAGPYVNNLGLRFAVGMGFKNLYLLGVDMGSRKGAGFHHAKDSIYYQDSGYHPDAIGQSERDLRPANLGGLVSSNAKYDVSVLYMSMLVKYFADRSYYNCSDGVRMKGFTPKLLSVVLKSHEVNKRERELAQCFKELDYLENAKESYFSSFRQFKRQVKRLQKDMVKEIKKKKDFSSLVDYLFEELMQKGGGKKQVDCYRRLLRGTVFIEVSGAFYYFRRQHSDEFAEFYKWFQELIIHELEEMYRYTIWLADVLDKEGAMDKIADIAADAYEPKGFLHPFIKAKPLPPL